MFRARNTDPVTSWLAADSAKELAKHHATIIVDCLRKHGKLGKDGIANLTGLDSNQVARRVKEIERDGLICLTGQTVRSNSNRMEQEWQITPTQLTLI
jgi:transcription initiation factor IIE alpha subunit